jgi:hypothetical protein
VGEREASGDFDYLWDDPADADGLTSDDAVLEVQPAGELDSPRDDLWDEPGDNFWDNQPDPDDNGHFDAFNVTTWSFKPAPTPWYRTKQALTAIIAASAAVAAIVVSGVLLVFRVPGGTVDEVTSSVTPTAPTSAQPVPVATSAAPEPPLPPPPPPEAASPGTAAPETAAPETALPVNTAPTYEAPRVQPRQTKGPEINVTRSPISVAPQPRTGHSGNR